MSEVHKVLIEIPVTTMELNQRKIEEILNETKEALNSIDANITVHPLHTIDVWAEIKDEYCMDCPERVRDGSPRYSC